MAKRFLRAIVFLIIAVSSAWCTDRVVFTGTIIDDATTNNPVQGLLVTCYPVGKAANATSQTVTDASGKFSLSNDSAELLGLGYAIETSYPAAYQFADTTIHFDTSLVKRNNGIADTIKLTFNVGHHTPPPDTLLIKGMVLDTSLHAVPNAQVRCAIEKNGILFPIEAGSLRFDTLYFTTGADGSFMMRSQNIYAMKGGTFMVTLPAHFDPAKNKPASLTKGVSMKDSANDNLFDGNLDSVIVPTFYLVPPQSVTISHFQNKIANFVFPSNPVTVSIYSMDGRLACKIDNVKIEALDRALSSLNLPGGKAMLAQWSQSGTKYSKRIMNLSK
jgi:hypothetical protein